MSGPRRGRGRPALIVAAQAEVPSPSAPMEITNSQPGTIDSGSARSTPTLPDSASVLSVGYGDSQAGDQPIQRMKFKPRVPIRRPKTEVDVKPEISEPSSSAARGGFRGRGRGGHLGRRGSPIKYSSTSTGIFSGNRISPGQRHTPIPAPRVGIFQQEAEQYSDGEDDSKGTSNGEGHIDIDQVSGMGESAPTSLYRDRTPHGGVKGKGKDTLSGREKIKRIRRVVVNDDDDVTMVKAERLSPVKSHSGLPERDDEVIMPDNDDDHDPNALGQRVRTFMRTGGIEDEVDGEQDVNEAQKVDLSESESEEEEEDLTGDFIQLEDGDPPEDKLFMFQFPHLFPKFLSSDPVDMTKDEKPDIKPDIAAAPSTKGKKKANLPPPEGRIGTMVVMKSGRVKMVLGDNIVMNVTPGVPPTFIQHLVHVDQPSKSLTVLGEVNTQYTVSPDIDRLLQDLFIIGGQTPGDLENEKRKRMVKLEPGLVKLEDD
ncbi:RNA polymerase III RPC4-domain-containing protein [Naematelia encephala]|uniref:RNA polymerase III RPC4-domain-containing protein n=1 Tax=Naematelia encephala TaxID=71784 RepID=A0A1Y2BJU7_9TREE|nr:RNA polymerase III RPC4-domain-containing protein [Naematelia encephala]